MINRKFESGTSSGPDLLRIIFQNTVNNLIIK